MPCSAEWTPTVFTVIIPLWVSRCWERLDFVIEEKLHLLHFLSVQPDQMNHSENSCTFSPVWVIIWLLKCPDWPNDSPHSEQVWFFTPLWASMCVFREPATPNDLLHWSQLYALSLLWVTMRLHRSPAWLNDWTLVHLASTVGERMSLNFDFVLFRSGTFNTVAFDKLEGLYFKDFF